MDIIDVARYYPDATSFKFGDNEALCQKLISLVRSGHKTATCDAVASYERDGVPIPEVGGFSIALNWDNTPALVIKTLSVVFIPFNEVKEEFALSEGENDSLIGWREEHQVYFDRNAGFSPEMLLVCERFRMVRDLGRR